MENLKVYNVLSHSTRGQSPGGRKEGATPGGGDLRQLREEGGPPASTGRGWQRERLRLQHHAESSDATLTPEIQARAANLSYYPARIYWCVYKNIRYEPYYGAMHGAEQTLICSSGNDIDTASLLIALLRASGYPARYVYGEANASREQTLALLGTQNVSGVGSVNLVCT